MTQPLATVMALETADWSENGTLGIFLVMWQVCAWIALTTLDIKKSPLSSKLNLPWLRFTFCKLWVRKEQMLTDNQPEPHSFHGYFLLFKRFVIMPCTHKWEDAQKWLNKITSRISNSIHCIVNPWIVSACDSN